MKRIGVRELRQHASRYLELVKSGETVEVTERGKLVALLCPPPAAVTIRERMIAAGRLVPASNPSGRLRKSQPVVASDAELSNQELLDEQRGERL